jgi:hypothetical protein
MERAIPPSSETSNSNVWLYLAILIATATHVAYTSTLFRFLPFCRSWTSSLRSAGLHFEIWIIRPIKFGVEIFLDAKFVQVIGPVEPRIASVT